MDDQLICPNIFGRAQAVYCVRLNNASLMAAHYDVDILLLNYLCFFVSRTLCLLGPFESHLNLYHSQNIIYIYHLLCRVPVARILKLSLAKMMHVEF